MNYIYLGYLAAMFCSIISVFELDTPEAIAWALCCLLYCFLAKSTQLNELLLATLHALEDDSE